MAKKRLAKNIVPPGFKLRHTLRGHKKAITRIAWSRDGRLLASPSSDGTILVWDVETAKQCQEIKLSSGTVFSVTWSPDGEMLASGGSEGLHVWNAKTGKLHWTPKEFEDSVPSVTWSPNGQLLAAAGADGIVLWNMKADEPLQVPVEEQRPRTLYSVAWSPNGRMIASGGLRYINLDEARSRALHGRWTSTELSDSNEVLWTLGGTMIVSTDVETIAFLDHATGRLIRTLENHTAPVTSISFSSDGRILASKSRDSTVKLWRCDNWETIAVLDEEASNSWCAGLAFNPKLPILATLGEADTVIRIWELDYDVLLNITPDIPSVSYANAKAVLVGDTGVGKSGLSIVLTGEPWVETGSTHGRRVWTFDSRDVKGEGGRKETREILLWDLAGQPDYRLIHQLHLTEVAVALVVFDSRSQTDPFAGVRHWDKALRQAHRVQGDSALPMKKFLVAARADVGRVGMSDARIASLKQELGFDEYFETSAKEGWNVAELAEAIHRAINWDVLPTVSSTKLFQSIKAFLVTEKKDRRLLSTSDDLYRAFLKSENAPAETEELRAQFETCIGRVESRGLIQRLSFGNLVLLQPELRDAYASAMVNAAKDEPDGLGCINEEDARAGRFRIPEDERVKGKEQEKLLLIATVEELLRHEIALREPGDDGLYLVFPSQLTRENPDLPDPEGKAVILNFEGPVLSVYATLAVRLSHSGVFRKKEMWKNAATYAARASGTCGIFLREIGEGRGELILFFDAAASEETRFQFEEYIHEHLRRRALPETIHRRRVFVCQECGTPVADLAAKRRRERGFDWIACNVCDPPPKISLLDREDRLASVPRSTIVEMDRAADAQRERETSASILEGKIATRDYDVFLCHNKVDKPEIKKIGEQLKERGILPWLDEWELPPGQPWQPLLEKQIPRIKAAAVFVGKRGIGPWQRQELDAFLREFARRRCPVIPVILPTAQKKPKLPIFLQGMAWVDFRQPDADLMERLIWGITKERSTMR